MFYPRDADDDSKNLRRVDGEHIVGVTRLSFAVIASPPRFVAILRRR